MKRFAIFAALALTVLLATVAGSADFFTGCRNTASATSDYSINCGTAPQTSKTMSVFSIKPLTNSITVSFWYFDGTAWQKLSPASAGTDTAYTVNAGDVFTQEFPINGIFPGRAYVNRTVATVVTAYWR